MRSLLRHRTAALLASGLIAGGGMIGSSSSSLAAEHDFYRDVYPFLKANCISCHNKTTTKASLNMETPELMIQGGDSGPSIIPGKSAESLIVEASKHEFDLEMPPKNNKTDAVNLTEAEIAVLKEWIDQGAKSSVQQERKVVWQPLAPGVDPIYTLAMTEEGRYAACGRSNQLYFYDLATRQFVSRIVDEGEEQPGAAHRALVQSLAFSPDGMRLASGSYREVKIWRREQGQPVARKADTAVGAQLAAMTKDARQIVCIDKDGALLVLNAADGKVIKKIAGVGAGAVQLLAVSPDATRVAIFKEAWKLSVWSLSDGKLLASQDSPDPALDKQSKEAQAKLVAAAKAESAAGAAIKAVQSDKAAATQELAGIKAQIAGAKAKEAAPDATLQKQAAAVEAKLAASAKAEPGVVAAAKAAETAKAAAEKAATEAAARASQSRNVKLRALTWTSDGKAIATAGDDKLVRVWPMPAAGSTAFPASKQLKGATAAITVLAAGANPDQLISAGEDNKVRIWSVSGAKVITEIASAGIVSVDLSPDGKQLVSGGVDGAVRIWDVATAKQTAELRGTVASTRQIAELDWVITAQALEQAFQKTVVARIEAQNKALDVLLKKAEDAIVAMTKALPEKEKAVKPAQDSQATAQKVVDDAAAVIAAAPEGKPDAAMDKALKSAQDKLITARTTATSAEAAFKAVQSNITDAEAQVKSITGTKGKNAKDLAAANAAIEVAKKTQAKASADVGAAKQALTKAGAKPLGVSFSADAQKVAATFSDGALNVWAVATGTPIDHISGIGSATTAASLIARGDGTFAACASDAALTITSAAPRWVLERVLGGEKDHGLFADRVNAVRFSPDGKTLATGGGEPSRSGDIILFDVATGKPTATWKERHQDSVVSLDFSPDGKLLASGAADKIARVTDIASGEEVNLFEGHTHYVTGVAFRSDGRVLATAGADGVVNAWDMILGERKKKIEGWGKEVTSLQFIGATNKIVTSAGDNLIRIVNDDGGQVRSIAKLPDFMQAAASTANGATIIGGGEDSFLRVWDGTTGKEVAVFGMKQSVTR